MAASSRSIRVRAVNRKVAKAVRESPAVSSRDLIDKSTAAMDTLVVEVPRDLAAPLLERLSQKLPAERLFDALTRDLGSSEGATRQVHLAADKLHQLDAEFGLLTSAQVTQRAGMAPANPSAAPTRWLRDGKVIAIRRGNRRLFPAFQFDATGHPQPALKDIATAYGPIGDGVGIALWFIAPNAYLEELRPVDVMGSDPGAVIRAAARLHEASA
ncbi:hypothetical protein [Leekyejoonella antrihumi]|uniref:DUF2384 domain-containing protein n=1 Tax=Leekyejoonella antrihumi TaxID=1660198 RepID=A0A563E8G8_9MICO|nr:hypothetical protein [Leekyejoonella antrihumi]TWP38543.1 hypothetical protein FGL98_01760 [Leekyejoonella antrihumi]